MAKNHEYEYVSVPWWSDMIMYWLEDQVAIAFHSNHHPSAARESIITSLELNKLDQFLQLRGFELMPFTQADLPHPPNVKVPMNKGKDVKKSNINDPIGKYLFSSPFDQGTIVIGFFRIKPHDMFHPVQGMTSMQGSPGTHGGGESNARQVVNVINANLEKLRQDGKIPIVAAMPNWLGGTTCFIHGCSFSPIPVRKDDPSGHWTIILPELSDAMQARTGKDVTVFVLDTLPETDQVKKASQDAKKRNWLLQDIVAGMKEGTINLNYQALPDLLRENAEDQLVTGRDIYGRTSGLPMSDHGLFVAGILHDLARNAKIECIRILNDFGAGDTHMLIHELEKIQKRMAPPNPDTGEVAGDLYNQAVVINLSLVLMPPRDDLPGLWFSDSGSSMEDLAQMARGIELLQAPFHMVIQSLTALGAVIVAAAGNDSNTPDMPYRPEARYPAGFPEVISVGAVDKYDDITSYSDYPALLPHHNGIATYGGGLATPVPPTRKDANVSASALYGPGDSDTMTTATNVDSFRGIYTSPVYPALSADDPRPFYDAPTTSAWAYWSGTSFAAPVISALAARVLESMKSSNMHMPSRYLANEVQWAITTAQGQHATLGKTLPIQPMFGVSLLKAVQKQEAP